MSSPVFRSQRLSRKAVFHNALISKNDTFLSTSPKNIQQKSPRSPLSSPVLRSQRKIRCGVGVGTDENTPSRKRPRGHDERHTTKMLGTPKSTTPRSRKSVEIDSPSTVFMNHEDSFLESVNFDELDSLCSSLELTPLGKTKALNNNRTPLSNSGINSSPYLLRKTPRRINLQITNEHIQPPRRICNNQNAITKARKQMSDDLCKEKVIANKCIVKTSDPKKLTVYERSVIPESSCSTNSSHQHIMSSISCSDQTNNGITKASSKKTSGRSSPDIFGEEQSDSQFDDMFGLTDTQMSCLDEAYFDGSSNPSHDGQDFIKPDAKVIVKSTSSHEAANIKNNTAQEISPLTSNGQAPHNKSGDSFGSPDSQLSFISTQGSQPLLDRFQNRFKDAVTSNQTDGEFVFLSFSFLSFFLLLKDYKL